MKIYKDEMGLWSFDKDGEHLTFPTREAARQAKREMKTDKPKKAKPKKVSKEPVAPEPTEAPEVDARGFIDMVLTAPPMLESKLSESIPHNIGLTQARALVLIGDSEVRQKYLVKELNITRASVSSLVGVLKKSKLISRRGAKIKLSPKGHIVAMCFKNAVNGVSNDLKDEFNNNELDSFRRVYESLMRSNEQTSLA